MQLSKPKTQPRKQWNDSMIILFLFTIFHHVWELQFQWWVPLCCLLFVNCNNYGSYLSCKYNFDCFHFLFLMVLNRREHASQRFKIFINHRYQINLCFSDTFSADYHTILICLFWCIFCCTSVRVYLCVCECVFAYVCVNVFVRMCTCLCVSLCLRVCVCFCLCMCVFLCFLFMLLWYCVSACA